MKFCGVRRRDASTSCPGLRCSSTGPRSTQFSPCVIWVFSSMQTWWCEPMYKRRFAGTSQSSGSYVQFVTQCQRLCSSIPLASRFSSDDCNTSRVSGLCAISCRSEAMPLPTVGACGLCPRKSILDFTFKSVDFGAFRHCFRYSL